MPPTATREEIRRAYRSLARRWHPDRFMAGPERDWANEKMADINAAYRLCLDGLRDARTAAASDSEGLAQVRKLIDDGLYTIETAGVNGSDLAALVQPFVLLIK